MGERIASRSFVVIAGVFTFIALLVIAVILIPEHLFVGGGFALAGAGLVSMWVYLIEVARKSRIPPADGPKRIELTDMCYVSGGTLHRIRFYLTADETVIHWISRRHVIWLLRRVAVISLLITVMVGVLVAFGVLHAQVPSPTGLLKNIPTSAGTTTNPNGTGVPQVHPTSPFSDGSAVNTPKIHVPNQVGFPWEWLLVVGIVICTIVGIYQWINWYTWYFIVTDKRLIIFQLPFVIFPFANYKDEPFWLWQIKNARLDGSVFQRRWGLAELNINTLLQPDEDKWLKHPHTRNMPHPTELEAVINELASGNSAELDDSQANAGRDLSTAAVALIAAAESLQGVAGNKPTREDDSPTQLM